MQLQARQDQKLIYNTGVR